MPVLPARAKWGYIALAVVCIVWGTTYLAIRIAVRSIPPFLLTGVRFALAGIILLVLARMRGDVFPRSRRTVGEMILVGVLLVCIGNVSVVWAEQWVPSGPAALFVAIAPFVAALLERMRKYGERLTRRRLGGMLLGFAGVAMLVSPAGAGDAFNKQFVIGALAIMSGCFGWQYGTIRAKYNLRDVPPFISSGVQMVAGGIAVGLIGLAIGEAPRFQPTREGWLSLAYLTIAGSVVAYTAYIYAVRDLPTSISSLYAYINPVVAVLLGWLILDEQLTWLSILAMCVILAGVALVKRPRTLKTMEIEIPK